MMKSMTKLAAVLALFAALPTVPALSASTGTAAVPYCSSRPGEDHNLRQDLELRLLVKKQYIIALDDWNGCLKAITVDSFGKTTIAYYDENLRVVRQDS
jgi:hypothetical protein